MMNRQLRSALLFTLLVLVLNSCVYSLFPLYTEDTLVYLPELEGKWQTGNDPDEYILIEKFNVSVDEKSIEEEPTDSIVGDGWVARFVGKPSIKVRGREVTDRDSIKLYYDRIYSSLDDQEHKVTKALMDTSSKMRELMMLLGDEEEALPGLLNAAEAGLEKLVAQKESRFKGSISVGSSKTYRMVSYEDDEKTEYSAHLVKIGNDYFLDLLPEAEQSEYAFGAVLLPTHTFVKVELKNNRLNIQRFDLEKMAELFERNQVRLRHENVDGLMVITARPKELQSFIKRYASKNGVFEKKEVFKRMAE